MDTLHGVPKWILVVVALGGIFFLLGQLITAWPVIRPQGQITVQGLGKVQAQPDVAILTLGVQVEPKPTAEAALAELETKFNQVVAATEGAGVAREDITTTNVAVNPLYDYVDGPRRLQGYEASESISIKVRDVNAVGVVIQRATEAGVNQVGGIQFKVDDPEKLQDEARLAALTSAQEKAKQLAKELGASLGAVTSFDSSISGGIEQPYFAVSAADGRGGAGVETPAGTQEIVVSATITYRLK